MTTSTLTQNIIPIDGRKPIKISDKIDLKYERSYLYPKQKKAIFNNSRYSIIEASTKSGKTAGCMIWLMEQALLHGKDGQNFWWIAPVYSQAKMVHRRIIRSVQTDNSFDAKSLYKTNNSELAIEFDNGAKIV